MEIYRIFFVIFLINYFQQCIYAAEEIFCTEQFCEAFREQKGCMNLGIACLVQNQTLNGEIFPGAVPCNCCDVCLENLHENDYCTIGSPDTAPPLMACGPGLYCTQNEDDEHYTCQKMITSQCFKEQVEFDENNKLHLNGKYVERPICDGDGNYYPVKCNPDQTCFCVNKNGQRIFGEGIYMENTKFEMKCECSRLNDNVNQGIDSRYPIFTSRCLEDGSFDPLQCIDDSCLCVERSSGFSDSDKFNVTEIDYKNIPCFNKTIHHTWTYFHECERIQVDILEEIEESEMEGFIVFDAYLEECQPDGWFLPVKIDETTKYCIDKYSRKIGNYSVQIDSPEAANMNCNCARVQYLLQNSKMEKSTIPKCCPNGNFEKIQCRDEVCFCVDENGLQIGKENLEADISNLSCYNSGMFC